MFSLTPTTSIRQSVFVLFCYLMLANLAWGQRTVTIPAEKQMNTFATFWHKTEINEIFAKPGSQPYNKLGAGLDFVYRRNQFKEQGSMFEMRHRESIRPWAHFQFDPKTRLSLSPIGYMATRDYHKDARDAMRLDYHEIRSTLQFFHHHKSKNGKWMHTWRYRQELRWQYNPNQENYRFFHRTRFRYRIRYIVTGRDFYRDGTHYIAISNELGLNYGKNVVMNTFNQSRWYVGYGIRVLNAARIEARYVDRIRTRGGTGFEFDHGRGFMVGIYIDQLSLLGSKDIPPVRFYD